MPKLFIQTLGNFARLMKLIKPRESAFAFLCNVFQLHATRVELSNSVVLFFYYSGCFLQLADFCLHLLYYALVQDPVLLLDVEATLRQRLALLRIRPHDEGSLDVFVGHVVSREPWRREIDVL